MELLHVLKEQTNKLLPPSVISSRYFWLSNSTSRALPLKNTNKLQKGWKKGI
jgi:hypothetical protein